jgi:gliding motility-associated-like protein
MQSQLIQYYGTNYTNNYNIAWSTDNFNTMRLGPDDKIYISTHDGPAPGPRVDVIHEPGKLAMSCNYQKTALYLGTGRDGNFEFPNFIAGIPYRSPLHDSTIVVDGKACTNSPLNFTLKSNLGADSFLWEFGDTSQPDHLPTLTVTHTFSTPGWNHFSVVTYRCDRKYTIRDSIYIASPPRPDLGNDTTLCSNMEITFKGPHGDDVRYLWSTGDTTYRITAKEPGLYWLKVWIGPCTTTDSVYLDLHPPLLTTLNDAFFICDKDKELVKLDAGEGLSRYKWFPTEDTTQWIIVGDLGEYFVFVSDNNGCKATDQTIVKRKCPVSLFFPNAFTPNEDLLNDVYQPIGVDVQEFSMSIYDRWGQLVYECKSLTEPWDGTAGGKPAPCDVYVYHAQYSGYVNKRVSEFRVKGSFSLVR